MLWLPAYPVAGKSLNRPDESKLSSVRFLLFSLARLRQPCADLRSACHGDIVGCIYTAVQFRSLTKRNYKSLLPSGRRCRANSETDEGNALTGRMLLAFPHNWPRRRKRHAASQFGIVVFAALTLAKLVASLALHPPVSATGSGGLRASSPPAAELLPKEKPSAYYANFIS